MISGLPKGADENSGCTFHGCLYTFDKRMNELLNEFVRAADSEGIWVSVDAHEFLEDPPDAGTRDIMKLALDTARTNCIESTAPKSRFVKIRCRNTQNKNFIKILFSCESRELRTFDKNLVRIREAVEQAGGYLKTQILKDIGEIRIALPTHR